MLSKGYQKHIVIKFPFQIIIAKIILQGLQFFLLKKQVKHYLGDGSVLGGAGSWLAGVVLAVHHHGPQARSRRVRIELGLEIMNMCK